MRGRTIILYSGFCLLAGSLASAVWLWHKGREARERVLWDGSTLQLQAAVYQKPFRIRTGVRWQDYAGTVLPESLAKKLNAQYLTVGGRTDTLVFLFTWNGFPTNGPEPRAVTFDEHGCEFGLTAPKHSVQVGNSRQLVFEFREFSRRSRKVGLRLQSVAASGRPGLDCLRGWSPVAEFHVPNPNRRGDSVWKAELPPITNSFDGVSITLLEIKSAKSAWQFPSFTASSREVPAVVLKFQISENGLPGSDWELANFKGISDALGPRLNRGGYVAGHANPGEYLIMVSGGLCLEEVWKLEAEFAQTGEFPVQDLWTIRSVAVPKDGSANRMTLTTNIHGAQLRFGGLTGANPPAPLLKSSISNLPVVHLACRKLPSNLRLRLIRALDQRGNELTVLPLAVEPPDYEFGLELPSDATTVDLTFAVTKYLAVRYFVKPAKIGLADHTFERWLWK